MLRALLQAVLGMLVAGNLTKACKVLVARNVGMADLAPKGAEFQPAVQDGIHSVRVPGGVVWSAGTAEERNQNSESARMQRPAC
jgi:hypothetical protein